MIGLTPQQRTAMLALQEMSEELGCSPTIVELAERLDYESPGALQRVLAGVAERGWILMAAGKPRGIRILHRLQPEEAEIVGLFEAPHLFTQRDLEILGAMRALEARKEGT